VIGNGATAALSLLNKIGILLKYGIIWGIV
jgi:hypothetical protein